MKTKVVGKCWIWQGWRTPGGHGQIGVNGRLMYTHRAMWTLVAGAIPADKLVLHKRTCTSPACIRPTHLYLGTQKENVGDSVALTRRARQRVSLTQRRQIKRLYAAGNVTQAALGRRFGVTQAQISRFITQEEG